MTDFSGMKLWMTKTTFPIILSFVIVDCEYKPAAFPRIENNRQLTFGL